MRQWYMYFIDFELIYNLFILIRAHLQKGLAYVNYTLPCSSLKIFSSLNTNYRLPTALTAAYFTAHRDATNCTWTLLIFIKLNSSSYDACSTLVKNLFACDLSNTLLILLFWTKSTPMPKIFIIFYKSNYAQFYI